MICVERLNGEILYLNWLQVELIEQIPETKIRMMNGDYYLVKDSVESIKDQVAGFFQHDKRMNDCLPPILFSAIFKLLKVLPDTELDAC